MVAKLTSVRGALLKCLSPLPIMLAFACAAHAHPHMFFKSTAQFVLDGQGRLAKLRVVFLVDELNTMYTFAELGVNKDGDNKLTRAERSIIAGKVSEGFGHYNFFTFLHDQDRQIALANPAKTTVEIQQGRLGLAFVIPLAAPLTVTGKSISLQLYDPTYFTAITIGLPPTVVGGGSTCSVSVITPSQTEQSRRSQVLLSQLSREETPDQEDVGATFAQTTRLICRG